MSETIEDAEVVGQELERHEAQPAPMNLFGTADPVDVIERAEKVATALKDVIAKKGLTQKIGNAEHVRVEGWTLLGSMLGVFPVCVWTRPLENGWEARVEARTRSGEVIGAAEAECLRSESNWKNRDDYALRSMAQTRATSKAMRAPLGFVVTLAGYDVTPSEEMPQTGSQAATGVDSAGSVAGAAEPADKSTPGQHAKIAVLVKQLAEKDPKAEGQLSWAGEIRERWKVSTRADLTKAQASEAIEWLQVQIEAAEIPFG